MRLPTGGARSIDRLHRGELSVVAAGLFAIVGVLALRVHGTGLPLRVDRFAVDLVGEARHSERVTIDLQSLLSTGFLRPFTSRATATVGIALSIGLAVVAWRKRDRWAALVSIAAPTLAVALIDLLAKPLIDRRRGLALAFPSGHAAAAAAAAMLVLVLLNRWYGWRCAVRWSPAVALFPLMVGTLLIRLDWHYPTDVVGGIFFGCAFVVALAAAIPAPGARAGGGDLSARR